MVLIIGTPEYCLKTFSVNRSFGMSTLGDRVVSVVKGALFDVDGTLVRAYLQTN